MKTYLLKDNETFYRCKLCRKTIVYKKDKKPNYCPNCGCKIN